jgi:CelD/BcsL family acetyltransferase involved in cellulose biosynthesis
MTVERLPLDTWMEYDRAFPAPTFFARPAWALALQESRNYIEAAPLRVRIAPNRWVIVPLVKLRSVKFGFKEYSGFPLGGYTMALHEDGSAATTREWNDVIETLSRNVDGFSIIPWPLGAVPDSSAATFAGHETAVVDLRDGLDAAMRNVEGIFRRMAGQAQRRGVTCARSNDADAVDAYYELLERSAKRWGIGKPTISKTMIQALKTLGGSSVEIWFAQTDEARIGGGVVFYGSTEFFFWSAAMDADYGRLRPSNALNFALMQAACDRGMSWYNLGSSEGLPGVARFKRDLGATSLEYREIRNKRLPYAIYSGVREAIRKPAKAAVSA